MTSCTPSPSIKPIMNHSRTKLPEQSREYRKLRLILPIRLRFLKFIVVEMGSENCRWFGFVVERVLAKKEVCFELSLFFWWPFHILGPFFYLFKYTTYKFNCTILELIWYFFFHTEACEQIIHFPSFCVLTVIIGTSCCSTAWSDLSKFWILWEVIW